MTEKNPERDPNDTNVSSTEYRERLLRKLNCLIAVLEVANKKVKRSLSAEGSDIERLNRIQSNLQETMDVCLRARTALEKQANLPDELRERLARVANEPELKNPEVLLPGNLPPGARVEMESPEEAARFRAMAPIDKAQIAECDLDELSRKLQAD